MHLAWKAFQKRMELGQKFLDKYIEEFKATTDEDLPRSPISTTVGLYEELQLTDSNMGQLAWMYENIKHHLDQMPTTYQATPGGWLPHYSPTSSRLHDGFPDCPMEDNPSTVYYSMAGGDRKEMKEIMIEEERLETKTPAQGSASSKGKGVSRVEGTILVLENIESSEELYEKVNEHDEALVEVVRHEKGEVNIQTMWAMPDILTQYILNILKIY
ncbi:hypothetical protein C8J57DRAFT_1248043 [Mycena rebaudengoi]|nr:hypothetical protein C8J57DRAFT_1248043 [Mycena rebaudengoi]